VTTAVAVLTRELRLRDNPARHAAVSTSSQVIPCFIVGDEVLARSREHATRLAFLVDALADLDASLRGYGGALVVRRVDPR
jgi:deoxyribodipyrimidine photo-lyase